MRFLTAAALLLLAIPAQARDWQLVGGNQQARSYMDMGSIQRSGDTATIKNLTTFRNPIGMAYAFELTVVYDCKTRRYREKDGIVYSATGAVLRTDPERATVEYFEFPAGSVEESGQLYACFGEHGLGQITDPFADSAREFGWKP